MMERPEDAARGAGKSQSVLSVSLPSRRSYERLAYQIVETRSRNLGGRERLDLWKARKGISPIRTVRPQPPGRALPRAALAAIGLGAAQPGVALRGGGPMDRRRPERIDQLLDDLGGSRRQSHAYSRVRPD